MYTPMYQYLYKEKVDETCKCKTQWLYEHQRCDKKPLHGRSPEKAYSHATQTATVETAGGRAEHMKPLRTTRHKHA